MNLLILAAGFGTRLGDLGRCRPKALVEVAGRPSIDWTLGAMRAAGCAGRTVVVTNALHHPEFVRWTGASTAARGYGVELLDNGRCAVDERRGAIGDLWFAITGAALDGDGLFVVAADNLFGRPPSAFIRNAVHVPAAIATADLGSAEAVRRVASVVTGSDGRIVHFEEKPASPSGTTGGIALYWFSRPVIPLIGSYLAEPGSNPDNAGYLFEWLHPRVPVHGFPIEGAWFDVGTPDALAEADARFREGGAGGGGSGADGGKC